LGADQISLWLVVEDAFEKLRYDLYYIKNRSFLLDAIIIFETVKTVCSGAEVNSETNKRQKAKGKNEAGDFRNKLYISRIYGVCLVMGLSFAAVAQSSSTTQARKTKRGTNKDDKAKPSSNDKTTAAPSADTSAEEAAIQAQINSVYQQFYNSYRLGAGDVVAIHIISIPKTQLKGLRFRPSAGLLSAAGNVNVREKPWRNYRNTSLPPVSEFHTRAAYDHSLCLESNSSEIRHTRGCARACVKIMTRPLRVFDAITASRRHHRHRRSSNVTVCDKTLWQCAESQSDVQKDDAGQANPEENFYLQHGDTSSSARNTFKPSAKLTTLLGVTGFASLYFARRSLIPRRRKAFTIL